MDKGSLQKKTEKKKEDRSGHVSVLTNLSLRYVFGITLLVQEDMICCYRPAAWRENCFQALWTTEDTNESFFCLL